MQQTNSCTKCGLCLRVCVRTRMGGNVIRLGEEGPVVDVAQCSGCGHCVAACPQDAIENPKVPRQELIGRRPTPEEAALFLRSARSVRLFTPQLVPRESMLRLLDIGRYPQTGGNTQGISYLVIEGREKIEALAELYCQVVEERYPEDPAALQWAMDVVRRQQEGGEDVLFRGCSELILALADADNKNGRESAQFSLTFISLLAPTMGIGTCWSGWLEGLATKEAYEAPFLRFANVPAGKRIRGAMMVGMPAVQYRRVVERNPLEMDWR